MAAGTVTVSVYNIGTIKKVVFAWTSGTAAEGGTASGATTVPLDGMVLGFTTIPSGAAAPTDNYDITITDAQGHDILLGAGANRDTANTEHVSSGMAGAAESRLTINVTNAGDAKQGTAILWLR